MKTFKGAEWDADDTGDNTYQELFKRNKRKKKSKLKPDNGEVEQDKKQKRKLKKILKKRLKGMKSSGILELLSDAQKLPENDNKVHRENNLKLLYNTRDKSVAVENPTKKQSRFNQNSEVQNVTKEQKRLLKKYSVELNILNDDSDRLQKELLREKKKQKKLKKKLRGVGGKELLGKMVDSYVKPKSDVSVNIKKLKILEAIKKSNHDLSIQAKTNELHPKMSLVNQSSSNGYIHNADSLEMRRKRKIQEKLKIALSQAKDNNKPILSLRQRMMEKLNAARFRFLNEQIYTTTSKEAQKIFKSDPDAFTAYHEGYQQQVRNWPLNPLDVIIKSIKTMPKNYVVADFGCGNAKLAKSVDQKVHSFDLVAMDDTVIACDMSRVPLRDESVDIAVFCLSLMGTNLHDYLLEANRVLKIGGLLKIAEVESRFDNVDNFIEGVQRFGFKKTWKDLSRDLFYFIDFKKQTNVKNRKKLPTISLLPCLYKKR